MERYNFEQFLVTLETYFPALDEGQKSIYFDSLKKFSPAYCLEASKILFEKCKKQYFPSLADLMEAFTEAYNESPRAHPEELDGFCPECEGSGRIIEKKENGQTYAIYCKCETGRKIFEGNGRFFEEHNLFTGKERQIWEAYKKRRKIK